MTVVAAQEQPEAASPPDDRQTVGTSDPYAVKLYLIRVGPVFHHGQLRFTDGSVLPITLTDFQKDALAFAVDAVCQVCGKYTTTPPECGACTIAADFTARRNEDR